MSLTVEVTSDGSFANLVQNALRQMCGCQSVVVDAMSGKVSTGPMSCGCYCDHRAGCNLLTDLVNDPRAITIWFSASSSGYDNNEVWWYTHDVDFGDSDVCGGTIISASILLAHELVHALLDSYTEDEAVRGENQIRMERCMAMRKEYAGYAVADFRVGVLDASNRPAYACKCSVFRGGICAFIKRLLCRLHSTHCFPRTFHGWWTARSMRGKRDV